MIVTFAAFFRANYSLVVSVAERRVDSRHDAEEIATEAFRVAWEHHQNGEKLTVAWLYGVVRNLVGNEYRSRQRRAALYERIGQELPRHPVMWDEPHAHLRDAVERLPEDQREILIMTYWDELTAPEIAGVLGLSPTAVRSRVLRARRLLKSILSDETHAVERGVNIHE